jgi:dihydrofolate reductase
LNPTVTLIVAAAENGVIGSNGALPWRIPEDLKRFKRLTLGKPCIMGRKTWDSLPKKPLTGRTNIVLTRDPDYRAGNAIIARSFDEALAIAAREQSDEIAIIGGEAIFAAALPIARRIHLTKIMAAPAGDAFMPAIDTKKWRETKSEGPYESGGLRFAYITLERRQFG